MKKFIVLSALAAVASTAFVACSSDDDLAQAPAVPEETVSEGIPFSVVAFNTDDTRAVRYDANGDGWEPTTGTTPVAATGNSAFVKSFKLYGKQAGASDAWIDNLIFARTAKTGDGSKFVPSRLSNNDAYTSTLTWPTDDTKATTFYAITDNDIPTTGNNTNLTGVNWTPTSGTFTYTVPTAASTVVKYFDFDSFSGILSTSKTNVVDADALRDLMVATAEKNAATAPANTVSLTFDHVMSGLAINAWFASGQNDATVPPSVAIHAVMVCGLKGYSTYTFGSGFAASTSDVIYYKEFDTPIVATKQAVTSAIWNDPTLYELVKPGEWLVIPQTCTPWNRNVDSSIFPSMNGAFISLLVYNSIAADYSLISFPLTTNAAHKADLTNSSLSALSDVIFNPGKTRTININIALGREHYLEVDGTHAQFCWEPGTFEIN
ncbi:MAG: fimbrillin family protein [Prevotella sp.]|nr:fimbrillin family protein [Prevotella sp.]